MSVSNNFASNLNSKALTLNDSNFNNTNVTNYFKKGLVTDPAKCLSQNQMKTVGLKNMGEKTLRECYNLAQSNRTNLMGYSKQTVSKKNYVNGQYNNAGNRCGGPPNFNLPYYSKYEYDNNCNELEDNFIVNGINLGEEWKRDLRYGQDYKTGITKMTDMNKKCGSTTYLSGRLKGQSVTIETLRGSIEGIVKSVDRDGYIELETMERGRTIKAWVNEKSIVSIKQRL